MYSVDDFITAAPDARVAVVAVAVVLGLAIGPRLERRQHRRPTRVLAVDVDPFNRPIQDDSRALIPPPAVFDSLAPVPGHPTATSRRRFGRKVERKTSTMVDDSRADPVAFIISSNVKHRHLNKGQQAMAVALAYPEPEKGGRGKKKTVENLFHLF